MVISRSNSKRSASGAIKLPAGFDDSFSDSSIDSTFSFENASKVLKTFHRRVTLDHTKQSLNSNPLYTVELISAPSVAFPETSYTQQEVGEILDIKDRVTWKLLKAPHIQKRHLYLPPKVEGPKRQPTPSERHAMFKHGLQDIGLKAVQYSFKTTGLKPSDVDILASVTSTAMPMPGVSAMLMRDVDFRTDV